MHLTSEKTEIPKWYHFLVHPVYRHENTVGDVGLVSGPVTASPISPAPAYTEYKRTGKCLRHTLILTTSVPDTCHLWRSPAPRRLLETRDPGWSLSPRQSYCGEPRGRRWRRVFWSGYVQWQSCITPTVAWQKRAGLWTAAPSPRTYSYFPWRQTKLCL